MFKQPIPYTLSPAEQQQLEDKHRNDDGDTALAIQQSATMEATYLTPATADKPGEQVTLRGTVADFAAEFAPPVPYTEKPKAPKAPAATQPTKPTNNAATLKPGEATLQWYRAQGRRAVLTQGMSGDPTVLVYN